MKKKFAYYDVLILVGIFVVITTISFLGFFNPIEKRGYDLLLHLKPSISQNSDIMLSNIDDKALEEVGTWPWTRDVIANCLVRMKELGAKTVVFDVEYLSPSQRGVDSKELEKLPQKFSDSLDLVSELMEDFSSSVESGQIPRSQVSDVATSLVNDYIVPNYEQLYNDVSMKLVLDNDQYFANSIRFFGNAWLTIGIADIDMKIDDEYKNFIYENILNYDVKDDKDLVTKSNDYYYKTQDVRKGFSPAIPVLLENAAGAGFANIVVDSDGKRRRVELLHKNDDEYIAQLSFAPLLAYLDTNKLEVRKNSIVIKDALKVGDAHKTGDALKTGESERKDIVVPTDSHGRLLINWIHAPFKESFKNESIYWLIYIDEIEDALISNLRYLDDAVKVRDSSGRWLPYHDAVVYLLSEYDDITRLHDELFYDSSVKGDDERYEKLFERRQAFFDDVAELFDPFYLEGLISRFDELSSSSNSDVMEQNKQAVRLIFSTIKDNYDLYMEEFAALKYSYEGSFVIIGNSAQGTTDLGTTPFYSAYPNVGTHANVVNTILSGKFIRSFSWLWMYSITTIFTFGMLLFRKSKKNRYVNIYSCCLVALIPIVSIIFIQFGFYLPSIASIFLSGLSFLGLFILHFVMATRDKKFITDAFGQCLSPAVVDEIVANPDSFKLGGEKVQMSAIFTDIQKFSSFSELLSASQLVALLNYYLTRMSDIIMAERGTVDKYEGDAIVAFIGAPLATPDHAKRAVRAALKMKSAEIGMNAEIVKIASSEKSENMEQDLYDAFCIMVKNGKKIFTRIGINSGEMIAGYMGSEGKKNYTMMGNNVNLASRLEGVNKQYSTGGILISQAVAEQLDDEFVLRRLDRVRVVNVNTPIRLYEPLCEKANADENVLKYCAVWNKVMDEFESGQYDKALEMFRKLKNARSTDNVASYYINLLENFFVKGKYPMEADGVGVEFEKDDGVFKLLQK